MLFRISFNAIVPLCCIRCSRREVLLRSRHLGVGAGLRVPCLGVLWFCFKHVVLCSSTMSYFQWELCSGPSLVEKLFCVGYVLFVRVTFVGDSGRIRHTHPRYCEFQFRSTTGSIISTKVVRYRCTRLSLTIVFLCFHFVYCNIDLVFLSRGGNNVKSCLGYWDMSCLLHSAFFH